MSDYSHDLSVDMSGYVPLFRRFHGACHCSICSNNPEIRKYFINDFPCRFDDLPCDRFSHDLGSGVCSWRSGGRTHFCFRFVHEKVVL